MGRVVRVAKIFAFCWMVSFALLWLLNKVSLASDFADGALRILLYPGKELVGILNGWGTEILETVWHSILYASIFWSVAGTAFLFPLHRDRHL